MFNVRWKQQECTCVCVYLEASHYADIYGVSKKRHYLRKYTTLDIDHYVSEEGTLNSLRHLSRAHGFI